MKDFLDRVKKERIRKTASSVAASLQDSVPEVSARDAVERVKKGVQEIPG